MAARTLFVVTGASRGLGAEFVKAVQAQEQGADLLLLSRSAAPHATPAEGALVETASVDLGDLDALEGRLAAAFAKFQGRKYGKAVLVNNAGALGPLVPVEQLAGKVQAVRSAIDLNVTACFVTTAAFLSHFTQANFPDLKEAMVLDVSSAAADYPLEYWSLYCSVKAARLMQTKVMAAESKLKAKQAEEAGQPAPLRVHAISYSPGIMDTALQVEISEAADHPSKTFLGNVVSSGKAVPTAESAKEMLKVIGEASVENGAFVSMVARRPEFAP